MRAERVSLLVLLKVPHLKGACLWGEEVEGGGGDYCTCATQGRGTRAHQVMSLVTSLVMSLVTSLVTSGHVPGHVSGHVPGQPSLSRL